MTTLKKADANNAVGQRELTLAKIEELNGKSKEVAKYIFPFFKKTDLSVREMAYRLGMNGHTNLSSIRTGMARIPIEKALTFAQLLGASAFDLGVKIMENTYRSEYVALRKLGLIVTKEERRVLDAIMKEIPLGDFDESMIDRIRKAIHG